MRNKKRNFLNESIVPRGTQGEERGEEEASQNPGPEAAGTPLLSQQKPEAGNDCLLKEALASCSKEICSHS